jgi:hypothetical protein
MKNPALCFMDTETLGLDPDAPVWEFAAIRLNWTATGSQRWTEAGSTQFFIDHRSDPWIQQMMSSGGASFVEDYERRYDASKALTSYQAAEVIHKVTAGAHIVGAVPSFDTERLAKLLRSRGFEPGWHYHLVDIENIIVGYLAAQEGANSLGPPWSSEALSRAVGVEPDDFARHTAMGDVKWVKAQWDAIVPH